MKARDLTDKQRIALYTAARGVTNDGWGSDEAVQGLLDAVEKITQVRRPLRRVTIDVMAVNSGLGSVNKDNLYTFSDRIREI